MGEKINLSLEPRAVHGKKVKTLRAEGMIPVVIYGADIKAESAQVSERVLEKIYQQAGSHTPVMVELNNKKHIAMIKEVDLNPVTHRILHASFHAVNATDPVVTAVPIRLIGEGESLAEREGLVVMQALEEVEVRALPMELPDVLEISIVDLEKVGDRLTVGDIKLPKGVEIVDRGDGRAEDDEDRQLITDLVIVNVYDPAALEAANEAAAGEAEDIDDVEVDNGGGAEDSAETADDSKSDEK